MIDVCLLGTGGMMPLPYRYLTSLMVRYKDADGNQVSRLISQSGEDGSFILMNGTIEAIG